MATNPDPLSTQPTPAATPAPRSERRQLKCVFCDCVMTGDGQDVYHMGEKAKEFEKLSERLAGKDEEIAKLQREIADLKGQLAAVTSSGTGQHGHRPGSRVGS